jgi:hypothetical protein
MASILPFIRNKSDFDDEATRLMGEAFDAACKGLRDTGQPIVVQEVIAKRIIKAAMQSRTSRFGVRPGSDLAAGSAADHIVA